MGEHSKPEDATQSLYPWRAVVRTVFALVVGFAPLLPVIVSASGISAAAPGVGVALAISAGVTRVLALPQVDAFLKHWAPWLATQPPGGS
ncbi:hypothetical protein R3Q06_22975 [Rhodococcus erythropolis]|uniref:hypothetical protein n=1 Tax=Rhodococcus erythropolis TaxID=1833 RepID=UPI002948E023|nr:hypothetical protein [Rhodococcus erythropolis]MDV6276366.1 hypothetical protein [Rhodococcus erythropolis]